MMKHPLHPPTVHFPVACWVLAAVVDVSGLYFGLDAWRIAAFLLAAGCAMAIVSILTGLWEFSKIPDDGPLHLVWWHMGFVCTAFLCAGISLFLHLEDRVVVAPPAAAYLMDVLLCGSTLLGGMVGGHMVYAHGVGVQRLHADNAPSPPSKAEEKRRAS